MNVTSLELSKELYEVSGWQVTNYWWREHLPNHNLNHTVLKEAMISDNLRFKANTEANNRFREENKFYPAYDLGYLMRKLPARLDLKDNISWNLTFWKTIKDLEGNTQYSADYQAGMSEKMLISKTWLEQDMPENALAVLIIHLFKQGLLTKEQP